MTSEPQRTEYDGSACLDCEVLVSTESGFSPMTFMRTFSLFLATCLLLVITGFASTVATDSATFDAGLAPFSVHFGETVVSHRLMAVTVLPGEVIPITLAPEDQTDGAYRLDPPTGTRVSESNHSWALSAPEDPGLYPVTITDTLTDADVRLHVFVLTPWDHNGQRLHGYRIGQYRQRALRGREVYEPPEGFIPVTDENKDVRVSPNFRLEQFLCKQTEATPQYALVRTRLLRRLEQILASVNEAGHDVPTLHVMSGYRTPYYNRAIGNTTDYSRHLYGDAADIFVDADEDEWMDDLNGDGRVTKADARELARIVRGIPTPGDERFNGGLGIYGPASHRGPFVHVDLRGAHARW